jgi:membrane protein DedA with SNARE-associated domain
MDDWIIRLVNDTGYWGVAFLMFIETVFPPVPSEVIMTVAGVSAQRGHMNLAGVVASGTTGAMIGNYLWFIVARIFGTGRLKALIDRSGRWLTLKWDDVDRGQALFTRHGSIIVLLARMLPTLRSLISVPAGIFKMSHRRFIVFSTIGTAGWSAALAGAGYVLGAQFQDVEKVLGPLSTVVVALIVIAYVWRLIRWKPAS